jgi:hypothetical protein
LSSLSSVINLSFQAINGDIRNAKTVYASVPKLKAETTNLQLKEEVNKYFKNTKAKEFYFYEFKKPQEKTMASIETKGTAQALCFGYPAYDFPFFCSYLDSTDIPNFYYPQFSMQISENLMTDNNKPYKAITYNMITDPKKPLVFPDPNFNPEIQKDNKIIMRYKIFDAKFEIGENKNPGNKVKRKLVR